jgi:hypothetical protein
MSAPIGSARARLKYRDHLESTGREGISMQLQNCT